MQVFRWVEVRRQLTWRFWLTRILPVGLFMALTLHFGNVVYLYLTVSFIQMLKVGFRHPQQGQGLAPSYEALHFSAVLHFAEERATMLSGKAIA